LPSHNSIEDDSETVPIKFSQADPTPSQSPTIALSAARNGGVLIAENIVTGIKRSKRAWSSAAIAIEIDVGLATGHASMPGSLPPCNSEIDREPAED